MFKLTVSDLCCDHLWKDYRELQFEHWSYLLSYKTENASHNFRVFFFLLARGYTNPRVEMSLVIDVCFQPFQFCNSLVRLQCHFSS